MKIYLIVYETIFPLGEKRLSNTLVEASDTGTAILTFFREEPTNAQCCVHIANIIEIGDAREFNELYGWI